MDLTCQNITIKFLVRSLHEEIEKLDDVAQKYHRGWIFEQENI
jgi:hypothetical protein